GLGKSLDALDEHTAIPASVKDREVPRFGHGGPEPPEIMAAAFLSLWRADGYHFIATRVQAARQPPDVPAFSRSVGPFVYDDDRSAFEIAQVLEAAQFTLELGQRLIIVLAVDLHG